MNRTYQVVMTFLEKFWKGKILKNQYNISVTGRSNEEKLRNLKKARAQIKKYLHVELTLEEIEKTFDRLRKNGMISLSNKPIEADITS